MVDGLERVRETKLVEVHGNDSSPFTYAKHWVERWLAEAPEEAPNAKVIGAGYSGQRCKHGYSVIAVTFEYDGDEHA